jgi:hypothetical protein
MALTPPSILHEMAAGQSKSTETIGSLNCKEPAKSAS